MKGTDWEHLAILAHERAALATYDQQWGLSNAESDTATALFWRAYDFNGYNLSPFFMNTERLGC